MPSKRGILFFFLIFFFAVEVHRHGGATALARRTTRQLGTAGLGLPRADLTSLTSQPARSGSAPLRWCSTVAKTHGDLVAMARSKALLAGKPLQQGDSCSGGF